MIDPKGFDEIAKNLSKLLPPGVDALTEDVRANMRAALAASLAKMDIVTREEFDVQNAVLARTREKVSVLEAKVRELEALITKEQ